MIKICESLNKSFLSFFDDLRDCLLKIDASFSYENIFYCLTLSFEKLGITGY